MDIKWIINMTGNIFEIVNDISNKALKSEYFLINFSIYKNIYKYVARFSIKILMII
jgi:hypothetical protein